MQDTRVSYCRKKSVFSIPTLSFLIFLTIASSGLFAASGVSLNSEFIFVSPSNTGVGLGLDYRFRSRFAPESSLVWGFQVGPRYVASAKTNYLFFALPVQVNLSLDVVKEGPVLRPGIGLGVSPSFLAIGGNFYMGLTPFAEAFFEIGFRLEKNLQFLIIPSYQILMEFFSGGNAVNVIGIKLALQGL